MVKTFSIEQIGSFLAYGIKNAYQFGYDENIYAIQSNLKSLITVNGIDQLTLSILHGINTQSNLDMLGLEEVDSMVELNIKECYESLFIENNLVQKFLMERMKISEADFIEPSPCLNVTNFSKCKVYCEWHQTAIRNSLMNIGKSMR